MDSKIETVAFVILFGSDPACSTSVFASELFLTPFAIDCIPVFFRIRVCNIEMFEVFDFSVMVDLLVFVNYFLAWLPLVS
tara:strand:+ start:45 stop:284 length:240 start_codon:yes stop_codon:yes gene_type:complete